MEQLRLLTDQEIEEVSGGIKLDNYSPGDDIRDLGQGGSVIQLAWSQLYAFTYVTRR